MEKKRTIFDLVGQIFAIFGFTTVFIMLFVFFFGENSRGYSSIFSLGKEGISLMTLIGFFLTSFGVVLLREFFFTDVFLKNLSITIRTVGMFVSVIVMIVVFVWIFDWFPMKHWLPWTMFLLCFMVCSLGGVLFSHLREKAENRKMQEALEHMKERRDSV